MDEDEREADIADLAVELEQRILAERRGDRPEARHEHELEAHHRQPGEPERDREVGPEVVVGLMCPDDGEHQRRENHADIEERPDDGPDQHAR